MLNQLHILSEYLTSVIPKTKGLEIIFKPEMHYSQEAPLRDLFRVSALLLPCVDKFAR